MSGSSCRQTRFEPSRGQRVKVARNGTRQVGQRSRAPGSRFSPGWDPRAVCPGEEGEESRGTGAGEDVGFLRICGKERSDMAVAGPMCEPRAKGMIRGDARRWRRTVLV